MDIKYIIESGMLESFAKNELTAGEAKQIETLLTQYFELGEELEKIYIRLEKK